MRSYRRGRRTGLLLLSVSCAAALAEPLPDPAFGSQGYAVIDFGLEPSPYDRLAGVATLPDGRIVVAGTVNATPPASAATAARIGIARLLADGRPDTTFGGGDGRVDVPIPVGPAPGRYVANAMTLQSDGKIVVAGTYYGGVGFDNDFFVLRVRADGSGLDPQFSGDGVAYVAFDLGGTNHDDARAVAVQADGRIVVAGTARRSPNQQYMAVARLTAVGLLDAGFSSDGRTTIDFDRDFTDDTAFAEANAIALQSDGKIVLAGSTAQPRFDHPSWEPNRDFAVARLHANGTPDTAFGPYDDGTSLSGMYFAQDDVATSVAVSELFGNPAGSRRIVLGGWGVAGGDHRRAQVIVFDDEGIWDHPFGYDGTQQIATPTGEWPLVSEDNDAVINAVAVRTTMRWTGTHFAFDRRIVFGGEVRDRDRAQKRHYLLGRLPYTAGYQYPDPLSIFAADVDGDGRAGDAGVRAMATSGNVVVAAGTASIVRRDGTADDDYAVIRVTLDE